MTYRPDIDGLRSAAILPVVIYHANPAWMPGGYIGVDVFFVISGYLITRLIAHEIRETGRFRFGNFYLRRVRRLLPALLATTSITWLGAMLLLSPDEMGDFGASMAAAVLSFSNIHFWLQTGYFDAAAATKPLLNTWSLSVEEQFYLIWPALLVVALSRTSLTSICIGLVIAILAFTVAAEWMLTSDPAAAFYLLPFRIPELGLGAFLALATFRPAGKAMANVLGVSGVAAIASAVVFFDEATPFPGIYALVPCLGTAAVIAAGPSGWVASAFRIQPLVWMGRISYSVYLVHWPLMVIHGRLAEYHGALLPDWALVVLSIGLGWVQFQLIEQRFRYVRATSWRPRSFALGVGAIASVAILSGAMAFWDRGHQWRIPADRSQHTNKTWFKIEQNAYCRQPDPSLDPTLATCQLARGADRDLFIWGDSHALHYVAGFAEHYPDRNIFVLFFGGCVAQSGFGGFIRDLKGPNTERCIDHNRKALAFLTARSPSDVVIAGAKRAKPKDIATATQEILRNIRQAGHTVSVLGDVVRPGVNLNTCASVPAPLVSDELLAGVCRPNAEIAARELRYNSELASLLPEILFTDSAQCPSGKCTFHDADGTLLFRDSHHLNVRGAIHFVGLLKPHLPF